MQDLGEDHRQRRGDLGIQDAEAAGAPGGHLSGGDFGDHGQHPVGDVVELDPLVEILRERLVHDRDRTHPADRLVERLAALYGIHPAGLKAQQCGNGLEIVLHPVVDFPDGGVLGDQFPLAAAQFGDIAQQHQGADMRSLGLERDGAQLDHTVTALDLEFPGGPAAGQFDQGLVHRATGGRQFGGGLPQVVAHQVGGEAEPVVGGEGIGAGVLDDPVGVEPDQPVAGARRGVHVDLLTGEGKRSCGDHLGEVRGALEVGELQAAGRAYGQQIRVAGDHAEHPALAAHRDRLDPYRHLLAPLRVALADDPTLVQGGVQHRAAASGNEMADHVVLVGGGPGIGPHLGDGDITGAVQGGDPQHEIGEGQVGEQLPLRDQQMQPLEVGVAQSGVLAYEIVHGGHILEPTGVRCTCCPHIWLVPSRGRSLVRPVARRPSGAASRVFGYLARAWTTENGLVQNVGCTTPSGARPRP